MARMVSSGSLAIGTTLVVTRSIALTYGGTPDHSISEYNRGGLFVPDYQANPRIPLTIGPGNSVRWSDYYASSNVSTDPLITPGEPPNPGGGPTSRDVGDVYSWGTWSVATQTGFHFVTVDNYVQTSLTPQPNVNFYIEGLMNFNPNTPSDIIVSDRDPRAGGSVISTTQRQVFYRNPLNALTYANISTTQATTGEQVTITGLLNIQTIRYDNGMFVEALPTVSIGGVEQTVVNVQQRFGVKAPNKRTYDITIAITADTPTTASPVVITNNIGDSDTLRRLEGQTTQPVLFNRVANQPAAPAFSWGGGAGNALVFTFPANYTPGINLSDARFGQSQSGYIAFDGRDLPASTGQYTLPILRGVLYNAASQSTVSTYTYSVAGSVLAVSLVSGMDTQTISFPSSNISDLVIFDPTIASICSAGQFPNGAAIVTLWLGVDNFKIYFKGPAVTDTWNEINAPDFTPGQPASWGFNRRSCMLLYTNYAVIGCSQSALNDNTFIGVHVIGNDGLYYGNAGSVIGTSVTATISPVVPQIAPYTNSYVLFTGNTGGDYSRSFALSLVGLTPGNNTLTQLPYFNDYGGPAFSSSWDYNSNTVSAIPSKTNIGYSGYANNNTAMTYRNAPRSRSLSFNNYPQRKTTPNSDGSVYSDWFTDDTFRTTTIIRPAASDCAFYRFDDGTYTFPAMSVARTYESGDPLPEFISQGIANSAFLLTVGNTHIPFGVCDRGFTNDDGVYTFADMSSWARQGANWVRAITRSSGTAAVNASGAALFLTNGTGGGNSISTSTTVPQTNPQSSLLSLTTFPRVIEETGTIINLGPGTSQTEHYRYSTDGGESFNSIFGPIGQSLPSIRYYTTKTEIIVATLHQSNNNVKFVYMSRDGINWRNINNNGANNTSFFSQRFDLVFPTTKGFAFRVQNGSQYHVTYDNIESFDQNSSTFDFPISSGGIAGTIVTDDGTDTICKIIFGSINLNTFEFTAQREGDSSATSCVAQMPTEGLYYFYQGTSYAPYNTMYPMFKYDNRYYLITFGWWDNQYEFTGFLFESEELPADGSFPTNWTGHQTSFSASGGGTGATFTSGATLDFDTGIMLHATYSSDPGIIQYNLYDINNKTTLGGSSVSTQQYGVPEFLNYTASWQPFPVWKVVDSTRVYTISNSVQDQFGNRLYYLYAMSLGGVAYRTANWVGYAGNTTVAFAENATNGTVTYAGQTQPPIMSPNTSFAISYYEPFSSVPNLNDGRYFPPTGTVSGPATGGVIPVTWDFTPTNGFVNDAQIFYNDDGGVLWKRLEFVNNNVQVNASGITTNDLFVPATLTGARISVFDPTQVTNPRAYLARQLYDVVRDAFPGTQATAANVNGGVELTITLPTPQTVEWTQLYGNESLEEEEANRINLPSSAITFEVGGGGGGGNEVYLPNTVSASGRINALGDQCFWGTQIVLVNPDQDNPLINANSEFITDPLNQNRPASVPNQFRRLGARVAYIDSNGAHLRQTLNNSDVRTVSGAITDADTDGSNLWTRTATRISRNGTQQPFVTLSGTGLTLVGQITQASTNTTTVWFAEIGADGRSINYIGLRYNAAFTSLEAVVEQTDTNIIGNALSRPDARISRIVRGQAYAITRTGYSGVFYSQAALITTPLVGAGVAMDVSFVDGDSFAMSTTPYLLSSFSNFNVTPWARNTINNAYGGTNIMLDFDASVGTFVFPVGNMTGGGGADLIGATHSWPSLGPAIGATRNFSQFRYTVAPAALEAGATFTDYDIGTISASGTGQVFATFANNTISSVGVS